MGEIFKHIIEEIKLIEALSKTKKVKVLNCKKISPKYGYFKKVKPKGFGLDITASDYWMLKLGENIRASIVNTNLDLKITDAYVKTVGSSISANKHSHGSKIHINEFQKKKVSKNQKHYYRTVIPLKTGFTFYNIIRDESFSHDGNIHTRGLIKVELDFKLFHVFVIENELRKYLTIECFEKLALDNFTELTWSIIVAIGYLSGHLVQDESYTFSYRNKLLKGFSNFTYTQHRDSIKSIYTPINANPYSWIKNNRKIAKKYYGKISEVNSLQLSKLCQIVHDEIDIKAIALLITESVSRSLLLMPAGLSVALEGLSEYFSSKNSVTIKPIKSDELSNKFKNDLIEALKKYKTNESFTGYNIIMNKIENINSPTNREKLKAPFAILNIPLTEIDEEILEYRNDFLHGNINLKVRKGKKSYSMDSFEISLRLLTLLNMSIMKMVGYQGYIINHVKTQEWGLRKTISEEYYRKN